MGRFGGDEFPAFAEYDGFSIIENQKKRITLDINGQPDDYILNANKGEYIAHFISAYKIPPLEIHGDQLSVWTEEPSVPAEMIHITIAFVQASLIPRRYSPFISRLQETLNAQKFVPAHGALPPLRA